MLNLISFMIGISFGSFANVCIYRIPRGLSVVAPRSFCPHCRRVLARYDLVPILSFVLLKGRCRTCKSRISVQYPLVELTTGAFAVLLYFHFGATPKTLIAIALFILFLVIAVIDWTSLIIPNSLVIAGLLLGVIDYSFFSVHMLLSAALSAALASAFTFIARAAGNLIFKKDTMGIGDIKLAGLIGFFIGFEYFLLAVWLAAILGIIYWAVEQAINGAVRDLRLPFGTFLSVTAIALYLAPLPSIPFIH